ncbi:hypothetical protein SAMN04488034_101729 [Salinimicrobium catena]|uniref:DUF2007 domain-containing protein n=1 Tax=Salinimicrobium catena TaxID=390640 RepID=A0A1H5JGD5_9FLAO|nr:hypothetical protein [Salinimicrobium catena]SDK87490.1 hypothetical protein SAMN04488140_101728 [Salinimicrobium catena]SEE51623.1 hypothetical protein SAMN04488034_101729 [Salinimicrobium catena]
MDYITVYATTDGSEVAVLKSLFQGKGVDYKINEDQASAEGKKEFYLQVAEKDRALAREILHESGYLKVEHPHREASASRGKKWMFIFLAALVLILVAILIGWFMTAP